MTPASNFDDETARAAVLRSADHVFYARGVAATAMAEIRDDSGVSLRRLYGMFPSKRDLVEAWLTTRHTEWMTWLRNAVDEGRRRGSGAVDAVFDALASWASAPGYRGCAFLNTAAEQGEIDETHREVIAEHKRQVISYLSELLAEAYGPGHGVLGPSLAVLVDGAVVQSAVLGTPEPIEAARACARRLVA